MTPRLLACALTLLAALPEGALAAKPKTPRPAGKNIEVEVMRGGSVRIPLRGYERNLNRLAYRPLEKPRHGNLTDLQQYNGPERQGPGSIIYTHGDDEDSTTDTFAFGVEAPLTKLTGRGLVTIRILDSPAQLQVTPSPLAFGTIAISDPPARRVVELANVGGGVLQGFLEPPTPFLLEGDGAFVLRRGQKIRVALLFAPERPGQYTFRIQPVLGDSAILTLEGEALSPLAVEVGQNYFTTNKDQSRSARATVKNLSQVAQEVIVKLPPGSPVDPVAPLILAPGQSNAVTLRISAQYKTHLPSFPVYFESAGQSYLHSFTAPAIPPELVVVTAPDFGEITTRGIAKGKLVLRNAGGAIAEVRLLPHETITPADGVPSFSIPPGEAFAMELEWRPGKDQPASSNVTLSFQELEIPVPVIASVASPAPTPTPDDPSVKQEEEEPSAADWALNSDIKLEKSNEGAVIAWRDKQGWSNIILQHRPTDTGDWQTYQRPAPHGGLLGWAQGMAQKVQKFFSTPIKRHDVDETGGEQEKFSKAEIDPTVVGNPDLWRLQGVPPNEGTARTITDEFLITDNGLVVAPTSAPAPTAATAPPPEPPATPARPRQLGPVTEIESAGIKAERRSALLQLALKHDPSIRGFRLERGAMVSQIDPKTGIPHAPEFEPINPPKATVEILALAEGEIEGRKLTVCAARIDGLPAGTRTYWRLVPAGPAGDLPPTTVLLVDTLPPPPFSWNTILLVSLILLLAGILYLRWRINRAPHR